MFVISYIVYDIYIYTHTHAHTGHIHHAGTKSINRRHRKILFNLSNLSKTSNDDIDIHIVSNRSFVKSSAQYHAPNRKVELALRHYTYTPV